MTEQPTEKKMVDVFSDVDRETAMTANPAGYAVAELGAEDERIVTMAADMSNTVADFIAKFPDRYIELGIAETNSVSVAAGLATAGLLPYIYSMSPFGMLKTAEQWRTDVDYNHLPVRLVGRLSGLAMGYFGTSHYAVEDIAIARTMNNTTVLSPGDPASTVSLMRSTANLDGPVYIRIAEGVGKVYDEAPEYAHGKWPRLRSGGDITLIGHGMGLGLAAAAAELLFEHDSIEADVFDAAYLRPYDEEALLESARKTGTGAHGRGALRRRRPRLAVRRGHRAGRPVGPAGPGRAARPGPRGRRARRTVRVLRADGGQRRRPRPEAGQGMSGKGGAMSTRERLLDPTGDSERDTNTTLAQPRPQSLRGLTVGLLDNTKPNGITILEAVGRELVEHYGVREVRMFAKSYFGTPVEESVINQMLHNCDFAVAGIGD